MSYEREVTMSGQVLLLQYTIKEQTVIFDTWLFFLFSFFSKVMTHKSLFFFFRKKYAEWLSVMREMRRRDQIFLGRLSLTFLTLSHTKKTQKRWESSCCCCDVMTRLERKSLNPTGLFQGRLFPDQTLFDSWQWLLLVFLKNQYVDVQVLCTQKLKNSTSTRCSRLGVRSGC